MNIRGVIVGVYRDDSMGDCTLGGVTSPERAKGKIFVVFDHELGSGNYTIEDIVGRDDVVCFRLVRRNIRGEQYIHAEPMSRTLGPLIPAVPMMGGNFIFTSDSRLRRICSYPIPVHDRFESATVREECSR